jgi:hypothetical protein
MLFSPEVSRALRMPFVSAPDRPSDAAGVQVQADASLDVQLGRLVTQMAAMDRQRQAMAAASPAYLPFTTVATLSAGGAALIDLGGPPLGMRWMVRVANIYAASGGGSSMGAAVAQLGKGQSWLQAPQNIRWAFSQLPNVANFGSDEFPVVYGEHVLASIQGGTAAQIVLATVEVQQYDPFTSVAIAAEQV